MPNLYPDNIYLQGNLRLTEKRTVRDDARISTRGNSRNPGPTQRPNNSIPLKEWIQEQMDNNALNVPCNCESETPFCSAIVNNDIFKFQNNGLEYQFLDILANDIFNLQNLSTLEIQIIDDSNITGGNTVESFSSQFYPYPIIKLTKPASEEEVGNIDEPQEFTYKVTGKCANDEGFESNIATVTILPVSVNIEEFINENR